jgi:HAD superfamily hydrolase (TIGR01509 family)
MMNNIKWIIFDLGGIVVPEVTYLIRHKIAKELNLSDEKLNDTVKRFQRQLMNGSMTLLEMYSILTKELSVRIPPDYLLQEHLNEYKSNALKHNAGTVELINNLKKKYGVACLSNLEIEIHDICLNTGLYSYFQKVFLSMELKMVKPDLEIYLKVLEELNCRPDEAIFTDDKIENVIAAKQIGMNAFHFSNLDQLKIDISKVCDL